MSDASIIERLRQASELVGVVGKDSQNTSQNYSFRGIDDVMAAVHSAFAQVGIVMTPTIENMEWSTVQTKNGTNMNRVVMTVRFDFHCDGGGLLHATTVGEAHDTADKAANKAMSAALKYALVQTLMIPTKQLLDEADFDHEELGEPVPREVEMTVDEAAIEEFRTRIIKLGLLQQGELKDWFHANKVPPVDRLPLGWVDALDMELTRLELEGK